MAIYPAQGLVDLVEQPIYPAQGLVGLAEDIYPAQGLVGLVAEEIYAAQGLVGLWGSAFADITTALDQITVSDWEAECKNIVPRPYPKVVYAGMAIAPPVLGDLTINLPLNGKGTASLELHKPADANGIAIEPSDICPPGYGDWAGKVRQHNGTSERAFSIGVKFAGETAYLPSFFPGPVGFQDRLSWPLEDGIGLIEQFDPDRVLPDIVKGAGDMVMAHKAAREAADAAGIQVDLRYPDYLLGQHTRGTATILGQLDALAKPMQAGRRIERNGGGDVLIYEQVTFDRPVSWKYEDRKNIKVLSLNELPRATNSFVLARFTPNGGHIGDASGKAFGRQSISFEPSRFVVVDQIKAINGKLLNWVFMAQGTYLSGLLGGGPPAYSGSTPSDKAEFTYEPVSPGAASYPADYVLSARGDIMPREENYRFTAESLEHQAIYGIVSAGKSIDEKILGSAAGAAIAVQANLRESIRKVWACKLETAYLNPFVRPGQLIALKDKRRRQNWTVWVIELVQYLWRGRYWSMILDCTRGEQ